MHNDHMKVEGFFEGAGRPTAIALILANCVPIAGAILFGWSIFSLMFLFWFENVIIGVLNVVKFLGAAPPEDDPEANNKAFRIFMIFLQLFFAGFFVVHYGGFCFVHGIFVFAIFGGKKAGLSTPDDILGFAKVAHKLLIEQKLGIAAASIFISHLFSLCYNYFYKGERRGADIQSIMGRPYGRIMVLHITIILGAVPVMVLGSPIWALVLLVVLKTIVDLKAHLAERSKMEGKRSGMTVREKLGKAFKQVGNQLNNTQ